MELTGNVACWKLVKSKSESQLGYGVVKVFDVIFQQVGLLGVVLLISLHFSDVVSIIKRSSYLMPGMWTKCDLATRWKSYQQGQI